jgi:hypothetical protein
MRHEVQLLIAVDRKFEPMPFIILLPECSAVIYSTLLYVSIQVLWDVMLRELVESYGHFEGQQSLQIQCQSSSKRIYG